MGVRTAATTTASRIPAIPLSKLPAFERRSPLGLESRHSFAEVFGRRLHLLDVGLELQGLLEGRAFRVVDRPLCARHRQRRPRGEALGELPALGLDAVLRYHLVDKTEARR